MKYLLDTNIIAYLADRDSIYNQAVVNHFTQLQQARLLRANAVLVSNDN
jgi:predicted nucleic acid-binding protein